MIKAAHDRVIVKRDDTTTKKVGGIILPSDKEKANTGTVVSVGEGRYSTETGVLLPMSVEEGDKVFFGRYAGQEIEIDGKTFLVLRDEEIFAIQGQGK